MRSACNIVLAKFCSGCGHNTHVGQTLSGQTSHIVCAQSSDLKRIMVMTDFGQSVFGQSVFGHHVLPAAGVSHDSPRAQTCTFEGPGASNTTKIPRDPQRKTKRAIMEREREKKKTQNFGPPPFWATNLGPKCGQSWFGQSRHQPLKHQLAKRLTNQRTRGCTRWTICGSICDAIPRTMNAARVEWPHVRVRTPSTR